MSWFFKSTLTGINSVILPLILYVSLDNPCTNLKGIKSALSMTEDMHKKAYNKVMGFVSHKNYLA